MRLFISISLACLFAACTGPNEDKITALGPPARSGYQAYLAAVGSWNSVCDDGKNDEGAMEIPGILYVRHDEQDPSGTYDLYLVLDEKYGYLFPKAYIGDDGAFDVWTPYPNRKDELRLDDLNGSLYADRHGSARFAGTLTLYDVSRDAGTQPLCRESYQLH